MNGGRKRVVFLIDSSSIKENAGDNFKFVIYHFVLKVLVSLNGQSLSWGWIFYRPASSKRGHGGHERRNYDFVEFSLSSFQDFISDFESWNSGNGAEATQASNMRGVVPAERLLVLLRDVVINFTWDMPDISSPQRRPKPTGKLRSDQQDRQLFCSVGDYVFTLTNCPRSREDWKTFVRDPLRDSFLPPSLCQQFKTKNIKLFFVDTSFRKLAQPDCQLCSCDCDGFTKSLQRCEGTLLSVYDVVWQFGGQSVSTVLAAPASARQPVATTVLQLKDGRSVCSLSLVPFTEPSAGWLGKSSITSVNLLGVVSRKDIQPHDQKIVFSFACTGWSGSQFSDWYSDLLLLVSHRCQLLIVKINTSEGDAKGLLQPLTAQLSLLHVLDPISEQAHPELEAEVLPSLEKPAVPGEASARGLQPCDVVLPLSHAPLECQVVSSPEQHTPFPMSFAEPWFPWASLADQHIRAWALESSSSTSEEEQSLLTALHEHYVEFRKGSSSQDSQTHLETCQGESDAMLDTRNSLQSFSEKCSDWLNAQLQGATLQQEVHEEIKRHAQAGHDHFDVFKTELCEQLAKPSMLRQQYTSKDKSDTTDKLSVFQLQVVLRLELLHHWPQTQSHDRIQEIVSCLRVISMSCTPADFHHYLEEVLVSRYCSCLQEILLEIYDALDLDPSEKLLPDQEPPTFSPLPSPAPASVVTSNSQRSSPQRQFSLDNLSRRQISVPVARNVQKRGRRSRRHSDNMLGRRIRGDRDVWLYEDVPLVQRPVTAESVRRQLFASESCDVLTVDDNEMKKKKYTRHFSEGMLQPSSTPAKDIVIVHETPRHASHSKARRKSLWRRTQSVAETPLKNQSFYSRTTRSQPGAHRQRAFSDIPTHGRKRNPLEEVTPLDEKHVQSLLTLPLQSITSTQTNTENKE